MTVTSLKYYPKDKENPVQDLKEGHSEPIVEIDSGEGAIERFIAKMKKFRDYPPAQFAYHAYGNRRGNWTINKAVVLVKWAQEHAFEIRAWENPESAIQIICVKDPDRTENSGWDLYQKMEGKHDSYGLASFYEFYKYGLPLMTEKGTKIMKLKTGFGIRIGKGSDWVLLD